MVWRSYRVIGRSVRLICRFITLTDGHRALCGLFAYTFARGAAARTDPSEGALMTRHLLARQFSLPFMLALLLACGISQAADTWNVDPAHSSINWRASHLNTGYVFGRFDKFE